MNKLVCSAVVAATLVVPAISFAQAVQPLTRAQVRAELVALEKAGYNPATNEMDYPQNLIAAQQQVDAQQMAQAAASGYGAPAGGTSAAGK